MTHTDQENITEPLMQAQDIYKYFGRRAVLKGASLAIHPEEIVTLIGPNGSGKTTLLRILLGLEPYTRGTLTRKKGLKIGYVPQRINFTPVVPLTVRGFLGLFSTNLDHIHEIATELRMGRILSRQLFMLSGGEAQRVMLAQALLKNPDLLVLDEPVQGVDYTGQARIYSLIRDVSREHKCAVLMVSHDLHMVMAGTDKVLCLNGHICCSGTPQRVSRDPEFTKLFGADVARQLAFYTHNHDHRHSLTGEVVPLDDEAEKTEEACSHAE